MSNFCSNCGSALLAGSCASCAGSPPPITSSQPAGGYSYASATAQRPGAQFIGQWNWGACLLCPFWLFNHGRPGRGILYFVLAFIPIVNLACLGMAIAYGVCGNLVAVTSRNFIDDVQFVAVQNAWRNWGMWVTAISIVLGIIGGAISGLANLVGTHP